VTTCSRGCRDRAGELPPGAAPDGAGRPEGGVLTPLGLALLTLDGALLGAFGVGFTPIFVGGVPVPMGVVFTVLVLPWLVLRAGELDRRPGRGGAADGRVVPGGGGPRGRHAGR
jgi:hypothetical protein